MIQDNVFERTDGHRQDITFKGVGGTTLKSNKCDKGKQVVHNKEIVTNFEEKHQQEQQPAPIQKI